MLRHRNIGRICCIVTAFTLLFTMVCMGAGGSGDIGMAQAMGYEDRLFDTGRVHTIDIVMDDWDGFIENCEDEEYAACTVIIDGERYSNVAIRAKGNTSLSSVAQYGNDRYSFKIEFDHYDSDITYHGLDKLSLNNMIQDATFMKDYVTYTIMNRMGVAAPLCSYVYITVNGEDWGLYLAVEGIEESFIRRNYGTDSGEMYKPDSMSFGGGRGNGRGFDMDTFREDAGWVLDYSEEELSDTGEAAGFGMMPGGMGQFPGESGEIPEGMPSDMSGFAGSMGQMPGGGMGQAPGGMPAEMPGFPDDLGDIAEEAGGMGFGEMGSMGSADVMLQYIDDDPASYSNIFDNAVTGITEADQARLIESLRLLSEGDVSVVDIDAVIRYFVVHNFVCNDDSYTGAMIHNYYLYEDNGVLSMVPWDYNLAFGGFAGGDASGQVNSPIDSPVSGGDMASRPMVAWIFESEEYTAMYHEIYGQLVSDIIDSGWLDGEIARVSGLIAPYVEKDPTAFYTYEEFVAGVAALRSFCSLRGQSVAGQLSGEIPSTEAGQRADGTMLISAGGLVLSDMGSMSMGGRGGFADGDMPDIYGFIEEGIYEAAESGEEAPAEPEADSESLPEQGTETADPFSGMSGRQGWDREAMTQQPEAAESGKIWLLAACAAVIAAGIIAAALFKGKN